MDDGMDKLYADKVNLVDDLRAELATWQRTCASRDQRIDRLEQEVASKAREIGALEASLKEARRNYTTQLGLKDMANSRAAKHDQRAIDLQARLEASRALVERLNNDVIDRDEALEATRIELLKQVDDWKEDSAAWRAAWRAVGKIRDKAYAERDMWKEEAKRLGLDQHQKAKLWKERAIRFGTELETLKQEHAAQLAESTEIARLKLKHHHTTNALVAVWRWEIDYAVKAKREAEGLHAQIDHLEAQRAAWFSEISRLEKIEEESWGDRLRAEERQEIIGELAGALAHLLDEPLTQCRAESCTGHNGPKAHQAIQDARAWAEEKVAYIEELEEARKRQTARLISANEKIRKLEKESDRLAMVRVRRMRLIAALRDRIEELEEGISRFLMAEEGEEDWADLRYIRRWGQELWVRMPFWSEKLRRDTGVWTVTWKIGSQGWWVRMLFVDRRPAKKA